MTVTLTYQPSVVKIVGSDTIEQPVTRSLASLTTFFGPTNKFLIAGSVCEIAENKDTTKKTP